MLSKGRAGCFNMTIRAMWCLILTSISTDKRETHLLMLVTSLLLYMLVSDQPCGICLHRSHRLPVLPSAHTHAPDIASHLIPAAQLQTWSQLKPYRPSGHAGQKWIHYKHNWVVWRQKNNASAVRFIRPLTSFRPPHYNCISGESLSWYSIVSFL